MKLNKVAIAVATVIIGLGVASQTADARVSTFGYRKYNPKKDYLINISKETPAQVEKKLKKIKMKDKKKILVRVKAKTASEAKKKVKRWVQDFRQLPDNKWGINPFTYTTRTQLAGAKEDIKNGVKPQFRKDFTEGSLIYRKSKQAKGYYEYTPTTSAVTMDGYDPSSKCRQVFNDNESFASDYRNYSQILDRLYEDFKANNFEKVLEWAGFGSEIDLSSDKDIYDYILTPKKVQLTVSEKYADNTLVQIPLTNESDINHRFIMRQLEPYFSLAYLGHDWNQSTETGFPKFFIHFTPLVTDDAEWVSIIRNFDDSTKFYFFSKLMSYHAYYDTTFVGKTYTLTPLPIYEFFTKGKIRGVCHDFALTSLKFYDNIVLDSTDNSELVVNRNDNHSIAQYRLFNKSGQAYYVVVNNSFPREGFNSFTTTCDGCKACRKTHTLCSKNVKRNTKLLRDAYKWARDNGLTSSYTTGVGFHSEGYRWNTIGGNFN